MRPPAPPPPPSPGQLKKLAEQKESRHNFELLLIEAAKFYSQVLEKKVDPEILSEALDKIANNKNIGSRFTNTQVAGITLGASTLTGAGFLSIFDYGAKQIPGFDSLKGLLTESLLDSPLIVGGGAGFVFGIGLLCVGFVHGKFYFNNIQKLYNEDKKKLSKEELADIKTGIQNGLKKLQSKLSNIALERGSAEKFSLAKLLSSRPEKK